MLLLKLEIIGDKIKHFFPLWEWPICSFADRILAGKRERKITNIRWTSIRVRRSTLHLLSRVILTEVLHIVSLPAHFLEEKSLSPRGCKSKSRSSILQWNVDSESRPCSAAPLWGRAGVSFSVPSSPHGSSGAEPSGGKRWMLTAPLSPCGPLSRAYPSCTALARVTGHVLKCLRSLKKVGGGSSVYWLPVGGWEKPSVAFQWKVLQNETLKPSPKLTGVQYHMETLPSQKQGGPVTDPSVSVAGGALLRPHKWKMGRPGLSGRRRQLTRQANRRRQRSEARRTELLGISSSHIAPSAVVWPSVPQLQTQPASCSGANVLSWESVRSSRLIL